MNSLPSKLRLRWTQGWLAPPIWLSILFPLNKAANGSPMPPRCIRLKKTLKLIEHITRTGSHRTLDLKKQAHSLHHDLQKAMRRFGRQCRGQGQVFVKIVRQTEQQLLALGEPIKALAQQAQQVLAQATGLREATRERLASALTTALGAYAHIRTQSIRLTQGKKLQQCKIVNAYDLTIAPIVKGKSNCPAQFGRKPGLVSEPATGFIFATLVPKGNPSDLSYVLPLLDKVEAATQHVRTTPRPHIYSVAGDLGINDASLRQALHARGILTVGIPKTLEPLNPVPSPDEVRAILDEAGLKRQRTPHQVHLACACGYSRPVVESHIASLLARGAGQVRYKGHPGAVRQQGMTVMAHNGATLVRIQQQQMSKRAQKFRRFLGLKSPKINEFKQPKN